jgi:hypothetical protein
VAEMKNSSDIKSSNDLYGNLVGMMFVRSFTNISHLVSSSKKTWSPWAILASD